MSISILKFEEFITHTPNKNKSNIIFQLQKKLNDSLLCNSLLVEFLVYIKANIACVRKGQN